jgi:formate dehydrogenase maturation protein FdhE
VNVCSLLANPEVMRQLQNLQQQMGQQQQHEVEEKLRKLQEMKQQEEEFDKHLAQTVPVSASDSVIFYVLSCSLYATKNLYNVFDLDRNVCMCF